MMTMKKREISECLPDFLCFGFAMRSGFSVMKITEGMKTEICFAEKLNIEVRYISENDLRKSEVKNDKFKKN